MKKFIRKMALYVATAYANRIYRKAVKAAELRHQQEQQMIYVASDPIDSSILRTYNRQEFRNVKRILKKTTDFNISILKAGCWYHTANKIGADALSEREKEIRRLAFVKTRLLAAKLI